MPEIIGEYVDRLCTVEMELNLKGRPRDKTRKLYDAARARQKHPLTFLAAKGIIDAVARGDNVIFLTGAGIPRLLPHGVAACLAFALRDVDLIQDVQTERNMLAECVKAGSFDGVRESPVESVDATSMDVQASVVTMLRAIVANGLTKIDSR